MIPRILKAQEYGTVSVDGRVTSLEKRAAASTNPDKEWDTLGIHLEQGKLTAYWFVGQVWLPELEQEPEVVLRILPKIRTSAFQMYLTCLGDPAVSSRLMGNVTADEDADPTIRIFWADRPIPLEDEAFRAEVTLLLIARYLRTLFDLCQRHLRVASRKVEANLVGKIRGRPLVMAQLRQNVTRGRLDRVFCQFQTLSLDIPANQILKAALEQSLKYLRCHSIVEKTLWYWASFSQAALSGVCLKRIMPVDFKGFRYAGFFKPYQEPHTWARLILTDPRIRPT